MKKSDAQTILGIAEDMRHDILKMCYHCGKQNGHLGGCLSAVEILAVLYSRIMNIDAANRGFIPWEDRDRFIMSKGHAGIAMYAAMKHAGLLSGKMLDGSLRGENTILYRHPKINTDYGIECSVGSLGMGIGYGIGLAESFLRRKCKSSVFVMLGDGECGEGSVWESAAYAGHRGLENLTVIVDRNYLQLDGRTHDVLSMDNIRERWEVFGFHSVEIDGHNFGELLNAFHTPHSGRPLAVIADTVKGKGVAFAEDQVEWHDNYLSEELYQEAVLSLGNSLQRQEAAKRADFLFRQRIRRENQQERIPISLSCCDKNAEEWNQLGPKLAVGEIAWEIARQDDKFTLIYSDCANRIGIEKLRRDYPEKCIETGIAEQNQIAMAAAMANEGFHVFAVAYAPFITARVLDQIRVNLGYMRAPVCLIGLMAGLAASDLGATHMALEDIANLRGIPGIAVTMPADPLEIAKTMEAFLNEKLPAYIRITGNPDNEILHSSDYNYSFLKPERIVRGNQVALAGCGALIPQVVKAATLLEQQGISCEVLNVHTIKPWDHDFFQELKKFQLIVSIEEHSVTGGLGSALAEQLSAYSVHPPLLRLGTPPDSYYMADIPQREREKAGLTAERIAAAILKLLKEDNK